MNFIFLTTVLSIPCLSGTLEEGREALRQGDYSRAVVLLDRAVDENPGLKEAYILAAKAHSEIGDWIGAAEILERASERFQDPAMYAQLGAVYLQAGDYERAIPALERAVRAYPFDPDYKKVLGTAYFNSGVVAYRKDDIELAEERFRRAVELLPGDVRPLHNLAALLLKEGKADSALIFVEEALKISPEEPNLLRLQAAAYRQKEDFDGLLRVYRKLYNLQPDSVQVGLDLAMLYRYHRRTKEALALYDTLMVRFPKERKVFDAAAGYYRDHFRYDKVREVYGKFLRAVPGDRLALRRIAESYEAEGRWKEAQRIYKDMLRSHPEDPELLALLAEACRMGGDWEGTVEALKGLVRTQPDDKRAWLGLGEAYRRLGMFDDALRAYHEASLRDTLWGEPWIRIAEIYEQRGKREEAMGAYRRAMDAGTADPLPYHRLAGYALERGDTTKFYEYERRAVIKAIRAVAQTEGAIRSGLKRIEMDRAKMRKLSDMARLAKRYGGILRECLDVLSTDPKFEEFLEDLLHRYPGAKALWEYKGKYEVSKGNLRKALEAFRRLVRLDSSYKPGHRGMAEVLERMGRTRDAIAAYERLLQVDPNDEEPYRALIKLCKEEGTLSDLISKWKREMEFHPERALLQKYLSIALREVER
ncbi:MAG: hypothetical protein DRQ14_09330 [Candidatus Latescibacterota bacterium]|nr:MAG: hypothetical protein DRQ14_09330 [Candidatus Latescibacterota bacterium]